MRRRFLPLLLACLALAPAIGIEAALAGNSDPAQATLTVSEVGTGTGLVTTDPAGINCGTTCSAQFAVGTTVKFGAQPANGSEFDGLTGNGVTRTCIAAAHRRAYVPPVRCYYSVTLSVDTSVQATFNLLPPCIVPKVKGWWLWGAKRQLQSSNCRAGTIKHAFSRKVKRAVVISQKPRAGTRLLNGAAVNLVVSKGRRHAR